MIIAMKRYARVDRVARLRRIIAKEVGVSEAGVPEMWIARAVACGNPVEFIDEVDGGYDITVHLDHDKYVLSFRADSGVDLRVSQPAV